MTAPTPASAYAAALLAAAALLHVEATKHDEALAWMDADELESDEAILHGVEASGLRAMADRIMALPNPF